MPPVTRGSRQNVHVHVWHLLTRTGSIMDQNQKVLCVKNGTQTTLCFSHAVHQEPALLRPEVSQSGHTSFRNDKGVTRPPREDVKESVPALTTCNGMGWKAAFDDAFEQRRLAHECAWCDAALNPHADSEGARTQWPETPLRTARVSTVPSEEMRVWCICSASMSGWS